MKKAIFFLLLLNTACSGIEDSRKSNEKVWVYLEIDNSTEPFETEFDYFYGQIDKSILKAIRSGKSETLFELSNVRYIDVESDSIMIYEDDYYEGILFYKIKDVKHIDVHKVDPLIWQENRI